MKSTGRSSRREEGKEASAECVNYAGFRTEVKWTFFLLITEFGCTVIIERLVQAFFEDLLIVYQFLVST